MTTDPLFASVDELLSAIIVRVTVDRRFRGTGLVIAPDLVITCAHVVGPETCTDLGIVKDDQLFDAIVVARLPDTDRGLERFTPFPDLCLLRSPTMSATVFAPLDDAIPAVDNLLYCRGFTTTLSPRPTEEPSRFRYVGPHDVPDGFLLKLDAGEAVPGMSGAPLLDPERGTICGILKTSRGEGPSAGGWGIPVEAVRHHFPHEWASNQSLRPRDVRAAAQGLDRSAVSGVIIDVGSVRGETTSGKPASVLFTITNRTGAAVKVPSISLELVEATRLDEPHFFLPEGLPDYFDVRADIDPEVDRYELLDLDHVLEPEETEGYRLEINAVEGWSYRLQLSSEWHVLGETESNRNSSEEFVLEFRVRSSAGLTAIAQSLGRDDNDQ